MSVLWLCKIWSCYCSLANVLKTGKTASHLSFENRKKQSLSLKLTKLAIHMTTTFKNNMVRCVVIRLKCHTCICIVCVYTFMSFLCVSLCNPPFVCACRFAFYVHVSVNKLLCLCLFTSGLTNWLVVTTNTQQSPHHRLVLQRGKHHGNGSRWSHPQPTLPQRLPSQPTVVMETAVAAREPHSPGVWRTLRPGGGWEWSVQVKHETQKQKLEGKGWEQKAGWHKTLLEKKTKRGER